MARLNMGIGISDFKKMRTQDRYYIDKTGFIEEFLTQPIADVSLITRPRRFGKTLTMNMLKEFFDINAADKTLFEGLEISKNGELCREWQNQYPVLYITFKECIGLSYSSAIRRLADTLDPIVRELSFLLESPALDSDTKLTLKKLRNCTDEGLLANSLNLLCQALYAHYQKKVIVLIDEYDVPIHYAHQNNFYTEMTDFIRRILGSVLKDSPYLQFAVLTGCLRISKESIFTGLNNFKCYGISDNCFSDAFGFTNQEVDKILADAGLEDKKTLFQEWYDGYIFGKNSESYCPWDVINYVVDLQTNAELTPKLYWNNTSGNAIIREFLESGNLDIQSEFEELMNGGCVEIPLAEQQTYALDKSSSSDFWNIMYLTGYLTKASEEQIQKCGKNAKEGNTILAIPNKEIREIYRSSIKIWVDEVIIRPERENFLNAFWNGDEERVSEIISSVLSGSISCRDYYESFYHGALFGMFFGSGSKELSNREGGLGYYDLLIMHPIKLTAAIIEIKRADSVGEMEETAEKALKQIESKQYDKEVKGLRNVLHWGMAFYQKRCIALVKKVR